MDNLAYSFTATKDGTLVSVEVVSEDDVVHTFPKEEIFVYGDVEQLHDLLVVKNVEAWRALPEKIRKHLMCTTKWQYHFNEGIPLPNLIINDLEIRWNGVEWVVVAFHPEK